MEIISEGYCHCGCGQKTRLAPCSDKRRGWINGHPLKFIVGHAPHKNCNGTVVSKDGYLYIKQPNHHRANSNGYVPEHVLIAEKALGKPLPLKAVVHHIKGNTTGKELVICQDQAYHLLLHRRARALKACGHANWLRCPFCKQYDDPENLALSRNGNHGRHRSCASKYQIKARLKRIANGGKR